MDGMTQPYWIDPLATEVHADITPSGVFESLDIDLSEVARPADIAEALWLEALDDFLPTHDKDWAEWSLIYFFKHYLGSAATNAFADVHYELAAILQDPEPLKRVLALFPREHAKTTIVTFGFVLWCIVYRKKLNIVICSDSKLQAKEFLRTVGPGSSSSPTRASCQSLLRLIAVGRSVTFNAEQDQLPPAPQKKASRWLALRCPILSPPVPKLSRIVFPDGDSRRKAHQDGFSQ